MAASPDRRSADCRAVAQLSPAGWAWYTNGGRWHLYRHLDLIDEAIVEALDGGTSLLIEAPPGSGKSELIRALCGYVLGRWPDKRVVHVSHTLDLSMRAGMAVREDLREYGREVWGVEVSTDIATAHHFGIQGHRGSFYGVGVGGSLTGRRADLIVSDDIVKDATAAYSATQRKSVSDWLFTVLLTRREPGCTHIGIQTRWHQEDAHGVLSSAYPGEYRTLRLPALAEANDPMGRAPGAPLWPERFDREYLEGIRTSIPSIHWSALYQQRPSPEAGGIWRLAWWDGARYTSESPGRFRIPNVRPASVTRDGTVTDDGSLRVGLDELWRFVVVDLATSLKTHADYTVVGVFGLTRSHPSRLLLLDVVRRRIEGPDINPIVEDAMRRWGARVAYYEDAGQQLSTIQYARRSGIPVRTIGRKADADVRLTGDKVAVALDATPFAAAGRFHVPARAEWLADWEAEMLAFGPGCAHDDQCDVAAWGIHVASATPAASPPSVRTTERRPTLLGGRLGRPT